MRTTAIIIDIDQISSGIPRVNRKIKLRYGNLAVIQLKSLFREQYNWLKLWYECCRSMIGKWRIRRMSVIWLIHIVHPNNLCTGCKSTPSSIKPRWRYYEMLPSLKWNYILILTAPKLKLLLFRVKFGSKINVRRIQYVPTVCNIFISSPFYQFDTEILINDTRICLILNRINSGIAWILVCRTMNNGQFLISAFFEQSVLKL